MPCHTLLRSASWVCSCVYTCLAILCSLLEHLNLTLCMHVFTLSKITLIVFLSIYIPFVKMDACGNARLYDLVYCRVRGTSGCDRPETYGHATHSSMRKTLLSRYVQTGACMWETSGINVYTILLGRAGACWCVLCFFSWCIKRIVIWSWMQMHAGVYNIFQLDRSITSMRVFAGNDISVVSTTISVLVY